MSFQTVAVRVWSGVRPLGDMRPRAIARSTISRAWSGREDSPSIISAALRNVILEDVRRLDDLVGMDIVWRSSVESLKHMLAEVGG